MIFRKIIMPLVIIAILSSCGGGSKDTDAGSNIISTGILLDSQVIGMHYTSTSSDGKETKGGVTNSKGEYSYFIGGTTTFFIGNIVIGTVRSDTITGIKDLSSNDVEQTNIARFLQTIDNDLNPDNGIEIDVSIQNNAHSVSSIEFNENFDHQFESNKDVLLESSSDIELVDANQANFHADKTVRLQSIEGSSLYKAIANEKNYSSNYYNGQELINSQKKRVYLWIWENLMARELDIEFELSAKEINDIENDHDFAKKYLDYADAIISVSSLASSTYDLASKAGTRTFAYELTNLAALTLDGCNATVKIYEAGGSSNAVNNDALCSTVIGITNPFGKTNSSLDAISPILSDFLPKALPEIMRNYKLGYLTKNGKKIFTSSYSKADYAALTVSILKIANDSYGAYRGSAVNSELSSRIIAKEWLSAWFRSGFDRVFMSKEVDNGNVNLTDTTSQIEALARKYANSGAICDFTSWITIDFVTCENTAYELNYDINLVISIISQNLAKSNALYKNISPLIGSISNDKGEIGVFDIDWSNYDEPVIPSSFFVSTNGVSYNSKRTAVIIEFKVTNNQHLNNVSYSYSLLGSSGNGFLRSIGGCPSTYPAVNICGGFTDTDKYSDKVQWEIDNSTNSGVNSEFSIEFCNQENICFSYQYDLSLSANKNVNDNSIGDPATGLDGF